MPTAPTTTDDTTTDAPSFRDLGVPKKLNDVLHSEGLRSAFPIQVLAVPPALEGRDLCGRAPTGSGKTLAFAIPLVENVQESRPHHPGALVLVPTRELAGQVRDTLMPLARARRRWVQTFYGGTNIKRDIAALRKGVDIAVCTPGRLEDLVQQKQLHLDEVRVVVLDEADRMADMGFLPVVKRMLDRTHADRQTLLFSATLDGDVDVLVKRYQHDPVRVEVDESEEEQGELTHLFWDVRREARKDVLADVLHRSGSTIVFARTKRGADRLAKQLAGRGLTTAAIHGNRSQNQRERALGEFSDGRVSVLVATDVAARGIHVDDVDTVVHYDLPATDKDYVHRSGRTGRAGRDGTVVSLVCEDQGGDLRAIQKDLDVGRGTTRIDLDAIGAAGTRPKQRSNGGGERRSDTSPKQRSGSGSSRNSNGNQRRSSGGSSRGSNGESPRGGARSRNRRRG